MCAVGVSHSRMSERTKMDEMDVIQIAVGELATGQDIKLRGRMVTSNDDGNASVKRKRVDLCRSAQAQEATVKTILFSINQTICQRLESVESKLVALEKRCQQMEDKLDHMLSQTTSAPMQVPMVAGSPWGVTQSNMKVRSCVPGRRHGPIVVRVRDGDDLPNEDGGSGSETGEGNSNGLSTSPLRGAKVTFITLNSEDDYPDGSWLGDENNLELRVRCPISPSDMFHISNSCRTAEKVALTLLDYLFHREVQAASNLSGQGKHGKKQLDPLMIYGIRCHLFHKFGITEGDWYRIKQSIDSKCRTAWRRKQRGQSLSVKGFSRRAQNPVSAPASPSIQTNEVACSDMNCSDMTCTAPDVSAAGVQSYTLASGQEVHIQQLGEDGQILPPGNIHIHQVHVSQDGQLIAVTAGTDCVAGSSDGSALPSGSIQVQYVQLAQEESAESSQPATALIEVEREGVSTELEPELETVHGQASGLLQLHLPNVPSTS
uniref:Protein BANP n=2 Tax=Eptatretus burgeri TaxID=7764 RepID=A0A8C4QDV2_EPTBU